ncbi:peptide-methionine (S)-S-oxide reductase MsrA [Colwellia sp. 6_MG-2023]|uniref:peptide-methionine (S)-S-oxide reductase MsrA n=1 Tax=Colwellia sp. 6_MG-2023 TaxID=3062676 RepID=UPI0026E12433|nr:peptide-methionine (S)-S-oxide reductase MsrA [Colwellia sp. 6_MG-2023]MDO6489486.1 peptide-methionine (S)-S-oxide reductase MsrA [Colwellia sp. 6_MG-2023]
MTTTDVNNTQSDNTNQLATLAGGCFWCIEGAFTQVKGIFSATSGYMGGQTVSPTYEEICTSETGHAEVVQLSFDPAVITYQEILEIFFTLHDPTQLNRQGNDIGTQYRSAIFYHDDSQKKIAETIIKEMTEATMFEQDIVTQVCATEVFYSGEEYHQDYVNNNPENQYCQAVVSPKLAKFRQTFVSKLK